MPKKKKKSQPYYQQLRIKSKWTGEKINLNFKPIFKRNKTTINMHESKKKKENLPSDVS